MLWLIVTGDEDKVSKPDSAVVAKAAEYKAARKKGGLIGCPEGTNAAMGCIKGACEDSQRPYIVKCETSKEMWAKLKTVHQENQSRIIIHYFFEELYTWEYDDSSLMADHIAA